MVPLIYFHQQQLWVGIAEQRQSSEFNQYDLYSKFQASQSYIKE